MIKGFIRQDKEQLPLSEKFYFIGTATTQSYAANRRFPKDNSVRPGPLSSQYELFIRACCGRRVSFAMRSGRL